VSAAVPADRPRCLVVLGMHRSGTSLACEVASLLGIGFGDRLLGPDANNPHGYFEDEEVLAVHERVLGAMGRSALSTLPFGVDDLPERVRRDAQAALRRILAVRLAAAAEHGRAWGVKDPRMARLLPLWRDVFAAAGAAPRCVLAVRDPAEACASFARLVRIGPEHAQLLWLQHYLDALREAGPSVVAVVDHALWFAEPEAQAGRLGRALAGAGLIDAGRAPLTADALGRCVDPRYWRHRAPPDPRPRALPLVEETWRLLRRAAATSELPWAELEACQAAYRQAVELLRPWRDAAGRALGHRPGPIDRARGRLGKARRRLAARIMDVDGEVARWALRAS
jgi:hypothetical protein